jgi:hypothetical protein
MAPAFPFRIQASVILAALVSLWSAIAHYGAESEYQKQNRDPYQLAAQAARLAGVREATPEKTTLGYVTDAEPGGVLAAAMFSGAQFVLAPRLLRQDAAQDRVLGNFSRPADFAALGGRSGLGIERDFGNGVILYRRGNGR